MIGRRTGKRFFSLCFSGMLFFLFLGATAPTPEEWRQATAARSWEFPRDHGAHQDYRTEWWYFTGNLKDDRGNAFGYELTFFRRGITHKAPNASNVWSLRDLYLAHFAVTDVARKRFAFDEAISRKGPGLAHAGEKGLDVRLLGWSATMAGAKILLRAQGRAGRLALELVPQKPPVLNGENGLSRKGGLPGQASYYASCSNLKTTGTLAMPSSAGPAAVSGTSWFDHEFGSNELSAEQTGWDWFGLHLSDGKDLMLYFLRRSDGAIEPASSGTIVDKRGKSRHLRLGAISLKRLGSWKSPKSGAVYPSRWRIGIPDEGIDLILSPFSPTRSWQHPFQRGSPIGRGPSRAREPPKAAKQRPSATPSSPATPKEWAGFFRDDYFNHGSENVLSFLPRFAISLSRLLFNPPIPSLFLPIVHAHLLFPAGSEPSVEIALQTVEDIRPAIIIVGRQHILEKRNDFA